MDKKSLAWAWAGPSLFLAWFILLLSPSATVFFKGDAGSSFALAVSGGFFVFVWLALGTRAFLVVTFPLVFLSIVAVAGDVLRGVDLIEMTLGPIDPREVLDAFQAYPVPLAVTLLLLATATVIGWKRPYPMPSRRARALALILLSGTAAALAVAMPWVLLRAWPLNAVSVQIATAIGRPDFIGVALPWAPVSPRAPGTTWSAKRTGSPPKREIYVLVVGESVRADRLAECGGQSFLAIREAIAVYCNVMAASTSTHLAVPRLISRDVPGAPLRVSTDATFLRAFEETGFRTYWLGEQIPSVAWPDANVVQYALAHSNSRQDLLPLVRAALAEPAEKKALVLHTYDAHFPYCDRFDPREAPIAVDCRRVGTMPTPTTHREWIAAYDNAVAETLAFLEAVISELRASGDEALLVYTSDHGENLLDDERGLYYHGLAAATRYDTRVPMIFWASPSWRLTHPSEVQALVEHRNAAAMHVDIVPTMLGAAGIGYADTRKDVVDLAHAAPRSRTRWVESRLGVVVDGDLLR